MGELVKYKGEAIKIGTCESLYYATYGKYLNALKSGLLHKLDGNDVPDNYAKPDSGYRFRFPFPDEDIEPLGALGYTNYYRGLLVTIERGIHFPKGQFPVLYGTYEVKSDTQPELVRKLVMENPNNVTELVDLEITQQKLITVGENLCLALVYRCPYSGQSWRIESRDEAEFICAQIIDRYMQTSGDEDFWRKVVYRVLQGYYPERIER
jgi:hypothetical protein